MVLDCFAVLEDPELDDDLRLLGCLIIFYEEINSPLDIAEFTEDELNIAVSEMYNFFDCGNIESSGPKHDYRLIDWEMDSQLICGAINHIANAEIRSIDYMHWWTFMSYYLAVGESVFSTVVSIRDKIIHSKKLEKWETKFRTENPQYFEWNAKTAEQLADEEYIKSLWNSGK